eukprot:6174811-Pleurochrysis_carterae.AAC.1
MAKPTHAPKSIRVYAKSGARLWCERASALTETAVGRVVLRRLAPPTQGGSENESEHRQWAVVDENE